MAVRNDFTAGEVLAAADLNDTFASKVDYALPVNAQTGTTYTFVAADAEKLTTASNAAAVTLTIPPQSSVAWGANTILRVVNYGAGAVTVAGGSGVTVTNTASTIAEFGAAVAIRTAEDAWTLVPFGVGEPLAPPEVEYLVVAGGGGGGGSNPSGNAGGGGGGGYRCSVSGESSGGGASAESAFSITAGTSYVVTVGAGGAGQTNGSNSSFDSVTATGGGRGGTNQSGSTIGATAGSTGGSGGGGGNGQSGGGGTANQGYGGGSGIGSGGFGGGGGGGAGAVGVNAASGGGNGGAGVASSITGSSVARGGGGGGGASSVGAGTGADGGGNGVTSGTPTAGAANTGGGGGGASSQTPNTAGGAGGKGVVIIRHPDTYATALASGATISTSGGYTIYTFNDSGTIGWAA